MKTVNSKLEERNKKIVEARENGESLKLVAHRHRISIARVSQIAREKFAAQKPPLPYGALFSELGSSGLTRFGGSVHEEFLRELQGRRGIQIYKEMRENHPVINAVFFAIEMALRQVKWYFEPASDNPFDKEAAEFASQCLEDMSFTWDDTLAQILTMLQYGFSIFEIVYKVRRGQDVLEGTPVSDFDDGMIGWRKWMALSQDTLTPGNEWIFDDSGGIQGINQTDPADHRSHTIPIEKMLLFRTSVAKNSPEGRSLLRGMYLSWYFSKNLMEVEAIASERVGAGIPVIYLGENTNKTDNSTSDLALAKQIVRDVRADAQEGVVLPYAKMGGGAKENEGMLFELVHPAARGIVDFDQIINRYDKRIALAGLAQFVMLGQEQVGSFALSKDQSDVFNMSLGAWSESIAQIIKRYALPRLFALNPYFMSKQLPELKHSEIAVPDLTALANYINALIGTQILTPDQNLEKYLREVAHLPPKLETINAIGNEIPPPDEPPPPSTPLGLGNDIPPPMSELASEKFQTQTRRAYGGAHYETATNEYQAQLERIYSDWYTDISRKLADEPDEDKREEILLLALADLESDLKSAGRDGILEAMRLGANDSPLTADALSKLAEMVGENDRFIEGSFIPDVRRKAETSLRDPSLFVGGVVAIAGLFATLLGRIASYSGAFWESIWHGVGDAVGQYDSETPLRVERVLDPNAQHCNTCPPKAGFYDSFDAMLVRVGIPGDGSDRCDGNCRCYLRVETAPNSGKFERMSERLKDADFFEEGRWITTDTGAHVFIKEGQSPEEAIGQLRDGGRLSDRVRNIHESAKKAEPRITKTVTAAVKKHNGEMAGLDFRLKSAESVGRKLAKELKADPNYEMFDAVRYTTIHPPENHAEKISKTLKELSSKNHKVVKVTNYWNADEYKGINVRMRDDKGQPYELQFHTPESVKTKERVHKIYEKARVESNPRALKRYANQMRSMWKGVQAPAGILGVGG